jgi:hypothetical protein
LEVKGSAASVTKADGTMYSGNLRFAKARKIFGGQASRLRDHVRHQSLA